MAYPRLCLSMLSGCQYTSYTLTSLTILSSYRHFPVWVSFSWNLSLTTGKGFELTKGDVLQQLVNLHSDNMCTGKCSRCIAVTLYPLALISIICNIVLFFPGGDIKYAKDGHITEEVKYMGGLVGGGLMVLLPALYIHLTGKQGCCGNRCGMFLSIAFAAVGVAGALYSFTVAVLGLQNGPLCKTVLIWSTPFKNGDHSYLTDDTWWIKCTEPKNIVQFNIGLFATLLATAGLEVILCAIQMINGLFGCLCGTCGEKGPL